jgi:hypothetical protein
MKTSNLSHQQNSGYNYSSLERAIAILDLGTCNINIQGGYPESFRIINSYAENRVRFNGNYRYYQAEGQNCVARMVK